ncbi:threonine/serine dehydratase [Loktanella sp. D2R18]|uniref:threonine ammonia-lyase n=1 Tax=Rhodobacterales TaxID=204455 RepID=UPI000DEBAF29|nr:MULTISPECIES: threonine/serine dehydratase [Rhodobacterales]MDO6588974.1 threonine/serine dehydratase [Yoonia sp. 1_MG-2023]RBW41809.1 threonine/serine dehydratase [Loktanella sp. D2R18]
MNIDMIRAAAKRIDGHARRTPILSSPFLDEIAGRRVFVKAECLQHTGSFKFRGAWSAVSMLSPDQIKAGVIAFSSGNHAQGIALAAQKHGAPAVIIMPSNAPAIKIANTRALGAEVVLYDRSTEDRDEIGDRLAAERSLTLIKPFDEPHVIAGQGTCGLEIAQELGNLSAEVAVCCGGGGLTSGVAMALATDAPNMRVRPVEPAGFDDASRSLISGKIERNAQMDGSLCDAIITPQPGNLTFPIMQEHCGPGIAVTDDECLRAMAVAFARLKIVIEPGGVAALAAALYHPDAFNGDAVVAIATGGNVDPAVFARALETLS